MFGLLAISLPRLAHGIKTSLDALDYTESLQPSFIPNNNDDNDNDDRFTESLLVIFQQYLL